MHSVIVGTAGHVDHGKTCLIKALTGIETDRLTEEKKRGITIELGFADLKDTEDQQIGIIDVPGHEKFVRNMLAGIGGIDIVLLVIAADEGIMPQTIEHFEILKMLGIPKGIVVITKSDLCDNDWMEVVRDDIMETIKNTFLQGAPIVEVSSHTGNNIDGLKEIIYDMARGCGQRKTDGSLLRIPIDRVFTIDGFGTVITGTLMEGAVSVGDEIELYPSGKVAKVRSLQVHGNMVEKAFAGQRTAVNIAGLKKDEVKRGQVVAAKNSMIKTMMIDVKLDMFQDSPRVLYNGSRLHLYYGSSEILCKAILLNKEELKSGETGYAQLRLEEEIALKKGDKFIVRFYSPVETIGGGEVLDSCPRKHKRFNEDVLESLRIKENGEMEEILEQIIKEESRNFFSINEYGVKLGVTDHEVAQNMNKLYQEKKVVLLTNEVSLHSQYVEFLKEKTAEILGLFHKENPVATGILKEEFRKKLAEKLFIKDTKIVDKLSKLLSEYKVISDMGNTFALSTFTVNFNEQQVAIRDNIEKKYLQAKYEMPETEQVILSEKDKKQGKQIHDAMVNQGILYRINAHYCIHIKYWDQAVDLLREVIAEKGSITLGEFRDIIQTSRKYAVIILEHLDEMKITVKVDDSRILVKEM